MSPRRRRSFEAFPPELPPARRYTLSGEDAFESQIKQDLSRLAADAELSLSTDGRALLLVGRFARGEGSAVSKAGEAHAYPGYRCLAILSRDSDAARDALTELERTWTRHLRTEVTIGRCRADALAHKPKNLGWLDVGRGSVEVLSGDPDVLSALPSVEVSELHPDEAGWLLTEQATLLALALRMGPARSGEPATAVAHRLHTMALACGDAEQLLKGHFAGGLRARLAQLKALGAPSDHWQLYADAIRFLTRPDLWRPEGDPEAWQDATLSVLRRWHLQLERDRVGTPESVRRYTRYRGRIFRQRRTQRFLGVPLFSRARRPLAFPYVGDPRERLARAAVAMAYGGDEAACSLIAERLLGEPGQGRTLEPDQLAEPLAQLYRAVRARDRDDPVDGSFYS